MYHSPGILAFPLLPATALQDKDSHGSEAKVLSEEFVIRHDLSSKLASCSSSQPLVSVSHVSTNHHGFPVLEM